MTRVAGLVMAAFWTCLVFSAEVSCPRAVSEHVPDFTNFKRFLEYKGFKGKTGQALAEAVWAQVSRRESGGYHYLESFEGNRDLQWILGLVADPVKYYNIYGYGDCAMQSPALAGLYTQIGFADARTRGIAGSWHCAMEVFYDDGWHYFDPMARGFLYKPDGTVSSVEEAGKDPDLWAKPTKKSDPWFSSNSYQQFQKKADSMCRQFTGSHTMDYTLRPGERLTLYWLGQGRWNHNPGLAPQIKPNPPGPGPMASHSPSVFRYGNGLYEYRPNLTSASSDFASGAFSHKGVKTTDKGLVLAEKEGEVVWRLQTPYIIVGKPADLKSYDLTDACALAMTVFGKAEARLHVSLDNGRTWRPAPEPKAEGAKLQWDLTSLVARTYGYQLKLGLSGDPGAGVGDMKLDTWVQVAPMSLPRVDGKTKFDFCTGDEQGKATGVWSIKPDLSDEASLKAAVLDPSKYTYDWGKNKITIIKGEAIFPVEALEGCEIQWLNIGAALNGWNGAAGARTPNAIYFAVDKPEEWKKLYDCAQLPAWKNHWHHNADVVEVLEKTARKVFVKYDCKNSMNAVRIEAHYSSPNIVTQGVPVSVTHAFTEKDKGDNAVITVVKELTGPASYEVDGPPGARNVFVRYEIPSLDATGKLLKH